MYEPKKDLYAILSSLEGVTAYQQRPETIGTFPSLTFYISKNTPSVNLNSEINHQDIGAVIDIWARDSMSAGQVLKDLEVAMRENKYILQQCYDVPDPDTRICHLYTQFNFIA